MRLRLAASSRNSFNRLAPTGDAGGGGEVMQGDALPRYDVEAQNLSRSSENKIHDDDVARRFGFSCALVPGVEVYAYGCHLPVEAWGREWLERGTIELSRG